TYTATLTVTDYAGHSDSDSVTVTVSPDPVTVAVPWAFSGGIEVPHDTLSGVTTTLKGVVYSLRAPLTYEWDFGDGSSVVSGTVTNKRIIQADHVYNGVEGQPFVATLTVTDADGRQSSDNYLLRIRADSLDIEINMAIDEGLWWLHSNQNQGEFAAGTYGNARISHGYWDNGGGWGATAWKASPTASAIQGFEVNAHLELGDVRENPYVDTVAKGLRDLPTRMRSINIGVQTYGNPDTNNNGIAIETTPGSDSRPPYEVGQVMDALVASGGRSTHAITGPVNVRNRSYYDIVVDMVDAYAWGQYDSATVGGGWRYGWNSHPDNSAAQWGAIGMLAAEEIWGIYIPQWVKDRNDVWMTYSYNGTGFGYTGGGNGRNTTPSGMVQLAFDDMVGFDDPATSEDDRDSRWATAEDYIAAQWNNSFWIWSSGSRYSYYSYYAFTKAMRSAVPQPVTHLKATGLDWFKDDTNGIARRLIDRQQTDGGWPRDGDPGGTYVGYDLTSAWSVIMLTPTLFTQPPVADAGEDRVWGVGIPLTLDGSRSFHLDPFRSLVKYEWDVDGDGVYDTNSTDPTTAFTYSASHCPGGVLPCNITVRLRVTDNNSPSQTDTDTATIIIAIPPHPPVADANGPYTCTAGLACTLDGSGSFDIDPTDSITEWLWDLDNDGQFDDASGETVVTVFSSPGLFNVGLQVFDNAVLNDLDGDGVQDPEERLDDFDFTLITVLINNPPVADANGPYTVNEGSSIVLDGSGSSDPDGNPISYAWDLDNDGVFDDATGVNPAFDAGALDNGIYTVGLKVSDSLRDDVNTTTITVNNVAPAVDVGADAIVNEGSSFNRNGSFTDPGPDSWTATVDYGDGSGIQPLALNPDKSFNLAHVYPDNGSFVITVTVTDDDGGSGSDSLSVTVNNVAPVVDVGADVTLNEGSTLVQTGSFTDPGSDNWVATVDYGNGSGAQPLVLNPDKSFDLSYLYPENGVFIVTVSVTDDDGGIGTDTLEVTVANVSPVVDAGPDQSVNEGDTVNFNGSFSDAGVEDTHTFEWDFGDGSPVSSGSLSPSHIYPDNGIYTATLTVTDDDGGVGTDSLEITVANVAPVVDAGPDQTVNEGDTVNFNGSFSDVGVEDTHTIEWNFGDGSPPVAGNLSPSHIY
ncbi:MAG: PKD domain-containing protein, partial [Gammaproteobacteria bacterium]|nr:PKD domain-containing protein [Gammaproteobacteria bacterium]